MTRTADGYSGWVREPLRVGLVLVAIFSCGRAHAQQADDPEALISKGIELRRQGNDLRAEGYFKRAYQIAPTPRATAQLGLVELALGDFVACERYLSDALGDDDAWVRSYQKTIEDSRRTARGHLLQIVVTDAPPGTDATVEKGRRLQLGADGVLWLPPEETAVVFSATGYQPVTTTVRGHAGTVQRLAIGMVRVPIATAPSPAEPAPITPSSSMGTDDGAAHAKSILRWTGVGVAAAGVVAGAVGVALLITGNDRRDDIEAAASSGTKPYDPADGNWQTLQHEGIGFMIAGAVAIAGGATLFVLERQEGKPADGVALVPAVGRNGLGIMGRF
jgi:hypothetical protein